jgi:rRNA-processing protein FCF1
MVSQVEESLENSALDAEQRDQILSSLKNLAHNANNQVKKGSKVSTKAKEERRNKHFGGFLDMMRMEANQQRGRYMVATRDIKVHSKKLNFSNI